MTDVNVTSAATKRGEEDNNVKTESVTGSISTTTEQLSGQSTTAANLESPRPPTLISKRPLKNPRIPTPIFGPKKKPIARPSSPKPAKSVSGGKKSGGKSKSEGSSVEKIDINEASSGDVPAVAKETETAETTVVEGQPAEASQEEKPKEAETPTTEYFNPDEAAEDDTVESEAKPELINYSPIDNIKAADQTATTSVAQPDVPIILDVDRVQLYEKMWDTMLNNPKDEIIVVGDQSCPIIGPRNWYEMSDETRNMISARMQCLLGYQKMRLNKQQTPEKMLATSIAIRELQAAITTHAYLARTWWQSDKLVIENYGLGIVLEDMIGNFDMQPLLLRSYNLPSTAGLQQWDSKADTFSLLAAGPDQLKFLLCSSVLAPKSVSKKVKSELSQQLEELRAMKKKTTTEYERRQFSNEMARLDKLMCAGKPMQSMYLIELLELLTMTFSVQLENRVADCAHIKGCLLQHKYVNSLGYKAVITGTNNIMMVSGEKTSFYLLVDDGITLANYMLTVTCPSTDYTENRTDLILAIEASFSFKQQKVIDIFSFCVGAAGSMILPTRDITAMQDAVWEPILEDKLLDDMIERKSFRLTNISSLTPLMAFAGIVPVDDMDTTLQSAWKIAVNKMCSDLCRLSESFIRPLSRAHFCMATSMGLSIAGTIRDSNEAAKFMVQFLLWAVIGRTSDTNDMTSFRRYDWKTDETNGEVSSYGSQILWAACKLTMGMDISTIGYKYIVDVLMYNGLTTGKGCIKIVKMGFWMTATFSSKIVMQEETEALLDRAEMMGVCMSSRMKNEIRMCDSVAGVLAIMCSATTAWVEEMNKMTLMNTKSGYEAAAFICGLKKAVGMNEDDILNSTTAMDLLQQILMGLDNEVRSGQLVDDVAALVKAGIVTEMEASLPNIAVCTAQTDDVAVFVSNCLALKKAVYDYDTTNKTTHITELVKMGRQMVEATKHSIIADGARGTRPYDGIGDFMSSMSSMSGTNRQSVRAASSAVISSKVLASGIVCDIPMSFRSTAVFTDDMSISSNTLTAGKNDILTVNIGATANRNTADTTTETYASNVTVLNSINASFGYSINVDTKKMMRELEKLMASRGLSSDYSLKAGGGSLHLATVSEGTLAMESDDENAIDYSLTGEDISVSRLYNDLTKFYDAIDLTTGSLSVGEKAYFILALTPSLMINEAAAIISYSGDLMHRLVHMINSGFDKLRSDGRQTSDESRVKIISKLSKIGPQCVLALQTLFNFSANKVLGVFEMANMTAQILSVSSLMVNVNLAGGVLTQLIRSGRAVREKIKEAISAIKKKLNIGGKLKIIAKFISWLCTRPVFIGSGAISVIICLLAKTGAFNMTKAAVVLGTMVVDKVAVTLERIAKVFRSDNISAERTGHVTGNFILTVKTAVNDALSAIANIPLLLKQKLIDRMNRLCAKIFDRIKFYVKATTKAVLYCSPIVHPEALCDVLKDFRIRKYRYNWLTYKLAIMMRDDIDNFDVNKPNRLAQIRTSILYIYATKAAKVMDYTDHTVYKIGVKWDMAVAAASKYLHKIKNITASMIAKFIAMILRHIFNTDERDESDETTGEETGDGQEEQNEGSVKFFVENDDGYDRSNDISDGTFASLESMMANEDEEEDVELTVEQKKLEDDIIELIEKSKSGLDSENVSEMSFNSAASDGALNDIVGQAGTDNSPVEESVVNTTPTALMFDSSGILKNIANGAAKVFNNIITNAEQERKKQELAARMTGIKNKVSDQSGKSHLDAVLSAADAGEINMIMLDNWQTLMNKFEIADVKCVENDQAPRLELVGSKKLLLHSKGIGKPPKATSANIDIIDLDCFSIVSLTSDSKITMPRKLTGAQISDPGDNRAKWMVKEGCVSDMSSSMGGNAFISGKMSVIANEDDKIEVLSVPAHLWCYGLEDKYIGPIDEVVALGVVSAESKSGFTGDQQEIKEEITAKKPTHIIAKDIFEVTSEYYSLVTADVKSWKGQSGTPVVDLRGNFLGVLIMQVIVSGKVEAIEDCSLLIIAKEPQIRKPILTIIDLKIVNCPKCNGKNELKSTTSLEDQNRDKDGQQEDKDSRDKGEGDKSDSSRQPSLINKASSWLGLNKTNSEKGNSDKGVTAEPTGAFQIAIEIIAENKNNEGRNSKNWSDNDSKNYLKKVCHLGGIKYLSEMTSTVLKMALEAMVMNESLFLCFSEPAAAMAISGMLSSMHCRNTFLRTYSKYRNAITRSGRKQHWVYIILSEDVLCWFAKNDVRSLTPSNEANRIYVVKPDDDIDTEITLTVMSVLSLSNVSLKIISYDASVSEDRKLRFDDDLTSIYALTKHKFPLQNAGQYTSSKVQSAIVSSAEYFETEFSRSSTSITCTVISFLCNVRDLEALRVKVARHFKLEPAVIMAVTVSALSLPAVWEIMRSCSDVIWYTGTSCPTSSKVVPNVSLVRVSSNVVTAMLTDCIKIVASIREDSRVFDTLTCHYETAIDNHKMFNTDDAILDISPRGSGTGVPLTMKDIEKKLHSLIVEGIIVIKRNDEFYESFNQLKAGESVKISKVTDADLLNEEAVMAKTMQKSVLQWVKEVIIRNYYKLKRSLFDINLLFDKMIAKVENKINHIVKMACARYHNNMSSVRRKIRKLIWMAGKIKTEKTNYYGSIKSKTSITNLIFRSVGVGQLVASIFKVKRTVLTEDARLANGLIAGGLWAVMESILDDFLPTVGNILKAVVSATSLAMTAGNVYCLMNSCAVVMSCKAGAMKLDGKIITRAILMSKMVIDSFITKQRLEVKVEPTGLMVFNRSRLSLTGLVADAIRILIDATEYCYKLIFESDLRGVINILWKGISSRSDNSGKMSTGTITAVPCLEYVEIASAGMILLLGIHASITFSRWRASNDAVSIGVLSDKKHTADIINVYYKDRSTFVTLARCVNAIASIIAISTSKDSVVVGAGILSLSLTGLEMLTSEKSLSGFYHGSASSIARVIWSDNKISSICSSFLRWMSESDLTGLGLNIIVATGDMYTKEESADDNWFIKKTTEEVHKEQELERIVNANLTDFTMEATEAYLLCKSILGYKNVELEDFSNSERWSMDTSEFDKDIDLNSVAGLKLTEGQEALEGSIRKLSKITVNQCRYMGRSRKILSRKREEQPELQTSNQASVFFLDEQLWDNIVHDKQKQGWAAAKDGRNDVLLAIAERNDVIAKFNIEKEMMKRATINSLEIIKDLALDCKTIRINYGPLDWWSVLANTNEKSTAGIIARNRDNTKLTAGFLGTYAFKCDAAKEMLVDGTDRSESHVINVFAKRRIEKKKLSNITGGSCVITRTIQANEVEMKVAVMEAFLVTDKLLKISRRTTGISIGMNFFTEYSEDDLNNICRSMKLRDRGLVVFRVSLDHSSFDSSQRNWSIRLMQETRKEIAARMIINKKELKATNQYIDNCYRRLKFRTMITANGDVFALTGQQMSGHATTSSDNSMKSMIYAKTVIEMLAEKKMILRCDKSIRVQGDDTKFDLVALDGVTKEDIAREMCEAMTILGQNVKPEKITVSRGGDACGFLSHETVMRMFTFSNAGMNWIETHWVPMRDREEILAMCATTLKQSTEKFTKKTVKDVSLMAAKAISFAIMYGTDYASAMLCATICWAASKILSCLRLASRSQAINSEWLPWLVAQSGLSGEFELDFSRILQMHSVNRPTTGDLVDCWVVEDDLESELMIKKAKLLQLNFKKVFARVRNWQWTEFNKAFRVSSPRKTPMLKLCHVKDADNIMRSAFFNKVDIMQAEVKYVPYTNFKSRVKGELTMETDLVNKVTRVYIDPIEDFREDTRNIISELEEGVRWVSYHGDFMTSDGIAIKDFKADRGFKDNEEEIWIVDTERDALLLEPKSWNVYEISAYDNRNMEDILALDGNVKMYVDRFYVLDERVIRSLSLGRANDILQSSGKATLIEESLKLRIKLGGLNRQSYKKLIIIDKYDDPDF